MPWRVRWHPAVWCSFSSRWRVTPPQRLRPVNRRLVEVMPPSQAGSVEDDDDEDVVIDQYVLTHVLRESFRCTIVCPYVCSLDDFLYCLVLCHFCTFVHSFCNLCHSCSHLSLLQLLTRLRESLRQQYQFCPLMIVLHWPSLCSQMELSLAL